MHGRDGSDGHPGDTGPAGTNGTNGATGASGTNNRIVTSIGCSGTISGLTSNAGTALNGLEVKYTASVTSSGDIFVKGSVSSSSMEIGGSAFYSVNANGASTGPIIFTADYATASWGYWNITLNRTTLILTATYTDSTLVGQSPVVVTFASSACTSVSY